MNNIPKSFWNVITTAATLLVVFLAVLSIKELKSIGYVGVNANMTNTVSVEGTGEAVAIPDIATFSFSVTENAKTVDAAQTLATEKSNAALKALKDAGVDVDKDISTQSYNINPHYEYQNSVCNAYGICPPSKSILTGYDVSQSFLVKVRDIKKAGVLFTTIGSLEVQNVSGLSFSVDEPDTFQAQARAQAITKAQAKAKELAKQLGVSLVRITSFSENGGNYPRPVYISAVAPMMEGKAGSTPSVPAGEQKITANVTITYEIK